MTMHTCVVYNDNINSYVYMGNRPITDTLCEDAGQFIIEGKVGLNLIGEYIKILRGKVTAWKKERINR